MRRERDAKDWALYFALAIIVLFATLLILGAIERNRLENEVHNLRIRAETEQEAVGGLEVAVPEPEPGPQWRFPIADQDYRYTSPFGLRTSPLYHVEAFHTGLDISGVWRAAVVAVADGVVTDHWPVGEYGGKVYRGHEVYGGYVEITHDGGMITRYAHMASTRVGVVRIGAPIRAGEMIGRVGNTGQSTAAHLHFEVLVDGMPQNPLLYIQEGS